MTGGKQVTFSLPGAFSEVRMHIAFLEGRRITACEGVDACRSTIENIAIVNDRFMKQSNATEILIRKRRPE